MPSTDGTTETARRRDPEVATSSVPTLVAHRGAETGSSSGEPGHRTSDADAALVRRIVAGDEQAFELLMRRYNQLLFRSARAIVRDEADAEDVVQEAYTKAFGALKRFEGRSSLATWLVRIVVNEARTRLRRSGRVVSLAAAANMGSDVGDVPDDASTHSGECLGVAGRGPEDAVGDGELRIALSAAVDRLPETLRTVFVLRCVEGVSVAETCACLDLSSEAVRVRLHRARVTLRDELDRSLTREARQLFSFGHERCDRIVSLVLERIHDEQDGREMRST